MHNFIVPYPAAEFKRNLLTRRCYSMVDDYVEIFTPYITRKGVRVWASQYGLKAFCLRIPREKYRG